MSSNIHPSAVIEKTAELGQDVIIGPNCVVDEGVVIGDGTILDANVVIGRNVKIGKNNQLYANCAIGRPPQMLGMRVQTQTGGLEIGDNNAIREQVTIHPSIYPDKATIVGSDNLFMIGVHLGHDCIVEEQVVMSNYCQLSGHCKVETGVWLSGMVGAHQFVTFGKWSYAAGLSGINHDVPPFVIISGHYPPEVRYVNKKGLIRAGFTAEQQKCLFKAFKKIYKGDGAFLDRVKMLVAENGLDENVRYMVESIMRSSEHRFGRYLEQFRD